MVSAVLRTLPTLGHLTAGAERIPELDLIRSQLPCAYRISGPAGSMCSSPPAFRRELPPLVQSLRKYYGLIRLLIHVRAACRLPEPARHTSPGVDETSQVPRKELLHVHKVSNGARFFPCKPFAMGRCCLLFNGMRSAPRN